MPKAEFKLKKAKRKRKFIKDKSIVNFLLEHMKPVEIDFSSIKIPSFINFLENEEKESIFPNESNESKNFKGIPIDGKSLFNSQ